MVAAFVLVTLFAVGLAAFVMIYGLAHVPLLGRLEAIRDVQGLSRLLEEVVSAKLLNLTRVGVLLIDPMAQAEAQRTPGPDSEAQQRVQTFDRSGQLLTGFFLPGAPAARVILGNAMLNGAASVQHTGSTLLISHPESGRTSISA